MSLLKFFGTAAPQVNIFDTSASRSTGSGSATATYRLANTGIGSATLFGGGTSAWTWLLSGLNSDYQVRAILNAGDTPSGDSLNAWLSLASTRDWTLTQTGIGLKQCTLVIQIRRVSDLVVIDSATVDIDATVG